jgi:hypothetical protein
VVRRPAFLALLVGKRVHGQEAAKLRVVVPGI